MAVEQIPVELSGLHRDYLEALQDNVAAKKKHRDLRDSVIPSHDEDATATSRQTTAADSYDETKEPLQPYLTLLKQRRRYEKLRIIQHYLDKLSRKALAQANYLDNTEMLKELPPPPEQPKTTLANNATSQKELDELLSRLDKAVLMAKHMLETERKRLAALKSRQLQGTGLPKGKDIVPESAKLYALGRARNELIQWVEEELGKAGNSAGPEQSDMDMPKRTRSCVRHADMIKRHYADYMKARRELVMVTSATRPSSPSNSKARDDASLTSTGRATRAGLEQNLFAYYILPHVVHHILPISQQQRSVTQQKSHVVVSMAKQQQHTLQTLERLADESHLLPAYPLLTGQSRFKHATAFLDRSRRLQNDTSNAEGSEGQTRARSWAFAADAARGATHDHVEDKLESGEKSIEAAEDVLVSLGELKGEKVNEVLAEGDDIWATQVKSRRKKGSGQAGKAKGSQSSINQETSLWERLDGKVGVIGDGI